MQLDQSAALVGEYQYAFQGAQQSKAVHRNPVGVVLRNDRVIVRIASFDKPADESGRFHGNVGITLIELQRDVVRFLR